MYLLDTHTFLWFIWNDPQLSVKAKNLIQNTISCYVSMCSLWEISIKASLNKLVLPAPYQAAKLREWYRRLWAAK